MKKLLTIATVAAAISTVMSASADVSEEESSGFSAWRVSAGARFGLGLRTKLRFGVPGNAVYVPTSPALGSPAAIGAALSSGGRVSFLDGAFIDPSSGTLAAPYTQNWQIPVSALNPTTGAITLNSAQSTGGAAGYGADDDIAFGTSIELSRTIYANEKGFGVDFAAGLSWMRRNNCFKSSASGTYLGSSTYVYTPTTTSSNFGVLTSPFLTPSGGYYGSGSPTGVGPVLDVSDFNATTISQTTSSSDFSVSGSGDYEEWEISLMLKPWWEVTEWWRLTGTIGVGVTRSEFEGVVNGVLTGSGTYSARNSYHEWNCYGIAGLGTMFRVWRLDLSFDVLARFLQDDMSIESDMFSGSISKPNVIFCSSLGFEF